MTERVAAAATWTVSGRLLARFIDLIMLVTLARMLSPSDFGLVALAMTSVLIAEAVLELPLTQVLIMAPEPTKPMFDTAFTFSVLRGAVIAFVLATLSWPLSILYSEPRLPALVCALSLAPILRGTLSPRLSIFLKRMDFRRDFVLTLSGKIVALFVSSGTAFLTGSYWAIALGTIATPLTMNALSYFFAPFVPRIGLSEWRIFAKIVTWNGISQTMVAVSWQIDRVLLGRFVSETLFGRFAVASDLSGIPMQALILPMTGPLLAAFSPRVGSASIGEAYCKASNALVLIASPVLLGISFLSEPAIRIVLGHQWLEAAPLLRWLSLCMLISLPAAPMPSLALASNRMSMVTIRTAIELALKVPITFIAISQYGVEGAIAARALLAFADLAVSMKVVSQLAGVSVIMQLLALWRTIVALSIMAVGFALIDCFPVPEYDSVKLGLYLAGVTSLAVMIYSSVLFVLWRACGRPAGIEQTIFLKLMILSSALVSRYRVG